LRAHKWRVLTITQLFHLVEIAASKFLGTFMGSSHDVNILATRGRLGDPELRQSVTAERLEDKRRDSHGKKKVLDHSAIDC